MHAQHSIAIIAIIIYSSKSSLESGVGPLCLGIVINHLTEGIVVDVISSSDLHIKLAVEKHKL